MKSVGRMAKIRHLLRRWGGDPAMRTALIVFIALRLFLSLWAILVLTTRPVPETPDERLRPYLGEPILTDGLAGDLLGPWQRFDAMRYLRIARQGYDAVEDSVFPPLYPLLIRSGGALLSLILESETANLLAAVLLSNLALIASLYLLYQLTRIELGEAASTRAVVYLVLFPTGFFLLAPYTESLFLALAMGAIMAAKRDRPGLAGLLAGLASLTRLTGWILAIPLAYILWKKARAGSYDQKRLMVSVLSALMPLVFTAGFMLWRRLVGLPPLSEVYRLYWLQTTGVPGADLIEAMRQMVAGARYTLYLDFLTAFFLLGMAILSFRRLGPVYGLYSGLLLLFILLPTSSAKPLFSFTRYALVFFPAFMLLGAAGERTWLNRLIVYPSMAFHLFFAGQFFMWGWVA